MASCCRNNHQDRQHTAQHSTAQASPPPLALVLDHEHSFLLALPCLLGMAVIGVPRADSDRPTPEHGTHGSWRRAGAARLGGASWHGAAFARL